MSYLVPPVHGKIYLITCLVNGRKYVGQTIKSLEIRFNQHLYVATNIKRYQYNTPISNAIRKYGKENFSASVLCSCSSQEELNLMEDLYIASLGTLIDVGGYNLNRGGARGKHSETTKSLMSSKNQGSNHPSYRHELKDEELALLYKRGQSTIDIASRFSVSHTTVGNRLKKLNIDLRPTGMISASKETRKMFADKMKIRHYWDKNPAYRKDISTEEIIGLYQQGLGTSTIGKRLGIAARTVNRRLRKAGITLRKLGTNQFSQVS